MNLFFDPPSLLLRFTSLANQISRFSFWEKLSRCDFPFDEVVLQHILSWRDVGKGDRPRGWEQFKSPFSKCPVFLLRVSNWNLPAAPKAFATASVAGTPLLPGEAPQLLSLDSGGGLVRSGWEEQKKETVFLFLSNAASVCGGGGAGGGNIGFELARILKHFILTPTTSTRQEYVKFRVVHVLGCFDFKLLVRGVFLNPLLKHLRGLWQVGAPAPRQPRVPTTIPASQWGMRCLYTNWPLIVS